MLCQSYYGHDPLTGTSSTQSHPLSIQFLHCFFRLNRNDAGTPVLQIVTFTIFLMQMNRRLRILHVNTDKNCQCMSMKFRQVINILKLLYTRFCVLCDPFWLVSLLVFTCLASSRPQSVRHVCTIPRVGPLLYGQPKMAI